MLILLIRALELLSAACTNSLEPPLVHFSDVAIEANLVDECRAPGPGAIYFALFLAGPHNGDRQLRIGSA